MGLFMRGCLRRGCGRRGGRCFWVCFKGVLFVLRTDGGIGKAFRWWEGV
jgi:hypothetical protein